MVSSKYALKWLWLPGRFVFCCVAYLARLMFCGAMFLTWFDYGDFMRAWRATE